MMQNDGARLVTGPASQLGVARRLVRLSRHLLLHLHIGASIEGPEGRECLGGMLVSVSSRIWRNISIFTARLGGLCTILHPPAGNPMSERALCTGRHRLLGTGGAPDNFSPWSPVTFQGWLELSPSRPGLRGHKKLGMGAVWGSTSLSL